MVWALDLDSGSNTTSIDKLNSKGSKNFQAGVKAATTRSNAGTLGFFWTPCLPPGSQECPVGYNAVAYGHGKVFDADLGHLTGVGCRGGGNGFNRVLCAPSSVNGINTCQWGPGRKGKNCNSNCPTGWLTITKNSHVAREKTGCKANKYIPLCCQYITQRHEDFCFANVIHHVLSGSLATRDDATGISDYTFANQSLTSKKKRDSSTEADLGGDGLSRRQSGKALARRARAGTGGLCNGALYLGLGDIPVEVPAAVISRYLNNFEYSLSLSATSPSSSTTTRDMTTLTVTITDVNTVYETVSRTCDGDLYPQACFHYSSVARMGFNPVTCYVSKDNRSPIVTSYHSQHNTAWIETWIPKDYVNPAGYKVPVRCERDEWPPHVFMQGQDVGYIRLLPGGQNGGVPNKKESKWTNICIYPPKQQVRHQGGPVVYFGDVAITTIFESSITTLNVMSFDFTNMQAPANDPWLLTANPCYPAILTNDPGFALLTDDPYYGVGLNVYLLAYAFPPSNLLTNNKTPPKRRSLEDGETFVQDPDGGTIAVDQGNTTRRATDEELLDLLGVVECESVDCARERAVLRKLEDDMRRAGIASAVIENESTVSAPSVPGTETTVGGTSTIGSERHTAALPSATMTTAMP